MNNHLFFIDVKYRWYFYIFLFIVFTLSSISSLAQVVSVNDMNAGVFDKVTGSFKGYQTIWIDKLGTFASRLFATLAAIEFAWTAIQLSLSGAELSQAVNEIVKKIMFIGFFYFVLTNAGTLIPAIIDSFTQYGLIAAQASGGGGLVSNVSPSSVVDLGLIMSGQLLDAVSNFSFFSNMHIYLVALICAIAILVAFVRIAVYFLITLIESYVVIGAAFVMLGFGASRWTNDYAHKYFAYAMAVGLKIFFIYVILGVSLIEINSWVAGLSSDAVLIKSGQTANVLNRMMGVVVSSAMLSMLITTIPNLASNMLIGSTSGSAPSLSEKTRQVQTAANLLNKLLPKFPKKDGAASAPKSATSVAKSELASMRNHLG